MQALITLYDKIQGAGFYGVRQDALKEHFSVIRTFDAETRFLHLRFLLPAMDRGRGSYGLKEVALARAWANAMCLNKEHPDSQRLLNYKGPQNNPEVRGDFCMTLLDVVQARSTVRRVRVTLEELDAKLDALDKDTFFDWCYSYLTPRAIFWVTKLILKDLKLGVSENSILKTWHPDAHKVYAMGNDLRQIAALDINHVADEVTLVPGKPFSHMLSLRPDTLSKVPQVLHTFTTPFIVQEKMDGERVSIHYDHGKFTFLSRNGHELPAMQGSLAKWVKAAMDPRITRCILDGELVAVDGHGNRLPFTAVRAGLIEAGDPDVSVVYHAFDLLLLNDNTVHLAKLTHRLKGLNDYFKPNDGFRLLPTNLCNRLEDVLPLLTRVCKEKGEGLVLKDPFACYVFGERCDRWMKLKVDYDPRLLESMDLVVLGAKFGEGNRTGKYSEWVLGLKIGHDQYATFCRVGAGLSFAQMDALQERLDALRACPPNVTFSGRAGDKVDVYFKPSVVLEVQAAEMSSTTDFCVGLTLRFPRIRCIREDKNAEDCDTLQQIHTLRTATGGRLIKEPTLQHFKRVVAKRPRMKRHIVGSVPIIPVAPTGLLAGRKFYITGLMKKNAAIASSIRMHGGRIMMQPEDPSVICLTDGAFPVKLESLKNQGFTLVPVTGMCKMIAEKTISI